MIQQKVLDLSLKKVQTKNIFASPHAERAPQIATPGPSLLWEPRGALGIPLVPVAVLRRCGLPRVGLHAGRELHQRVIMSYMDLRKNILDNLDQIILKAITSLRSEQKNMDHVLSLNSSKNFLKTIRGIPDNFHTRQTPYGDVLFFCVR